MCMSGFWTAKEPELEMQALAHMPYTVRLIDISGYYSACYFCDKSRCGNCALQFTDKVTVEDLLKAAKIDSNNGLFANQASQTREVQIEVVWSHELD